MNDLEAKDIIDKKVKLFKQLGADKEVVDAFRKASVALIQAAAVKDILEDYKIGKYELETAYNMIVEVMQDDKRRSN